MIVSLYDRLMAIRPVTRRGTDPLLLRSRSLDWHVPLPVLTNSLAN